VEGFRAEIRVENRRKASAPKSKNTIKNKNKLNQELLKTTNSKILKKNKL
jgi:hypothetical protein